MKTYFPLGEFQIDLKYYKKSLKQLGAYCLFTFISEPVHFHSLRKLALQNHTTSKVFSPRVLPRPQGGR